MQVALRSLQALHSPPRALIETNISLKETDSRSPKQKIEDVIESRDELSEYKEAD